MTATEPDRRDGRPGRARRLAWPIAVVLLGSSCTSADPPGGADLLAAGGDATWPEIWDRTAGLDDLPLEWATALVSDGPAGRVTVLVEPRSDSPYLVCAAVDGRIEQAVPADVHVVPDSTAADVRADGVVAVAIARRSEHLLRTHGPGSTFLAERPGPFPVGTLDLATDGSIDAGGLDDTRIARIAADGTARLLLGPREEGALVTTEDLGPVADLLRLDDGRIAFVARTSPGSRLHVLDDTSVRRVGAPDGDRGVEPGAGTSERPDQAPPPDRRAMTPLAPSPDGRILTTGPGPDGHPRIALVDPDTGDTEVLADLDGVDATVEAPVSAAVVGHDLVFLADHRLWTIPDVIDAAGAVRPEETPCPPPGRAPPH